VKGSRKILDAAAPRTSSSSQTARAGPCPAEARPAGALPGPFWGPILAASALRLLYLATGNLDLSPDEAHYWEWSRRLDLSYYSKGPLIAYLIRGLTETLGTSALAIRSGAVLLSLLGALIVERLGRAAFGDGRPGVLATVGLQLTPLVWAGSLLMTIDAPFLVLWIAALWALHRALIGASRGAWILAGVAVGLGLLAKYAMLFALPGLVLYFWRAPDARRWLARREPYLAAALALLVFTPVLVWNVRHGWVSARHVVSQGHGGGLGVLTLVEFVGSQVGVLTPLVAGLLGWAAWYGIREGLVRGREPYRFLAAFAVPILLFYGAVALQGKVQANWPAAAYPPLALVAAGALLERRRQLVPPRRRAQTALLAAAAGLALAITALGHLTDRLGVPPGLDPTTRLKGWQDLGQAVAVARRQMPAPHRTFLVSDRYQITSELAFYVEGRPPAYNVNLGRRLNQYDFWEGPETRLGWDALYVREGAGPLDAGVRAAFDRIDGPLRFEVRRGGRVVRTFAVYRGYGFRGVPPHEGPTTY
jgi:4-amino-4-deoxy-L-arabinose transferase-like glycosyltransferase